MYTIPWILELVHASLTPTLFSVGLKARSYRNQNCIICPIWHVISIWLSQPLLCQLRDAKEIKLYSTSWLLLINGYIAGKLDVMLFKNDSLPQIVSVGFKHLIPLSIELWRVCHQCTKVSLGHAELSTWTASISSRILASLYFTSYFFHHKLEWQNKQHRRSFHIHHAWSMLLDGIQYKIMVHICVLHFVHKLILFKLSIANLWLVDNRRDQTLVNQLLPSGETTLDYTVLICCRIQTVLLSESVAYIYPITVLLLVEVE